MRIEIKNQTHFDTAYLRKLFKACEEKCFSIFLKRSDSFIKRRRVIVVYSRRWHSGRATIGGSYIRICLPKKEAWSKKTAQVYLHELGHNLGLQHNQMPNGGHYMPSADFITNEPIPQKTVKAKPKINVIDARAAQAQAKLDEWTKKMNRAKTFVKKYQRKVKYYDKKMAASGTKPQSSS